MLAKIHGLSLEYILGLFCSLISLYFQYYDSMSSLIYSSKHNSTSHFKFLSSNNFISYTYKNLGSKCKSVCEICLPNFLSLNMQICSYIQLPAKKIISFFMKDLMSCVHVHSLYPFIC